MSNPDKLNKLIANVINFSSGERLTSEKLNKLIEILDLNVENISGAIGDIYDANFDASTYSSGGKQEDQNVPSTGAQERKLDIANIARLIGPASNLNPRNQIDLPKQIQETIPSGCSSFTLKYPHLENDTFIIPGYVEVNKGGLSLGNTFFVEGNTVYFNSSTVEELTVTYITDPSKYAGGPNYQGARFNVYPDPNQLDQKLSVTYNVDVDGNTTYIIDMVDVVEQQSSLVDKQETVLLDSKDLNFGSKMLLPEWFYNLDANSTIPQYLLYLKNYTTNESYTNAIYTKISDDQILVSSLLLGNQECIDDFDFRLITVGTDITTSIDDLRVKQFTHKHDGSFGEPKIDIKDIDGFYKVAATSGAYSPSNVEWNPISSYLHRDGYIVGGDLNNGSNAMRGALMLGLKSFDPADSQNNPIALDTDVSIGINDTYEILFGSNNTKIEGSGDSEGIENLVNLALRNSRGSIILQTTDDGSEDRTRNVSIVSDDDTRLIAGEEISLSSVGNMSLFSQGTISLNQTNFLKSYFETDLNTSSNESIRNGNVRKVISNKTAYEEELEVYSISLINSGAYTVPASSQIITSEAYVDVFDIYDANFDTRRDWGSKYYYSDTITSEERVSNFLNVSSNFKVLDFVYFHSNASLDSVDWNSNGDIVKFFCLGDKLNCIYDIDLLKNTTQVISPIWRLNNPDQRDYRNIHFEIFRGPAWLHQYKDELKTPGKVFKNEFYVNINSAQYGDFDNQSFEARDYDGNCYLTLNYDFYYQEDSTGNIKIDTNYMLPPSLPAAPSDIDLLGVPSQNYTNFFEEFEIKNLTLKYNKYQTYLQPGGYSTFGSEISEVNKLGSVKFKISNPNISLVGEGNIEDGKIADSIKVTETYCNGTFYVDVTLG
jgi:hypothetical protein